MGTDIGANRGQQPVPWFGPLDGPVGRVSESERLRRRLEHTRREIAQRDRQLALLPDRRSQDGFVRCVGQTCFPGEDAEGMKADLAECKKHCQDQAYGAFVVQGDGRAYFKRQKVGDCRRNLEPEAFSTTYLHYSVEVAKLCPRLRAFFLHFTESKRRRPVPIFNTPPPPNSAGAAPRPVPVPLPRPRRRRGCGGRHSSAWSSHATSRRWRRHCNINWRPPTNVWIKS
ncbi:unnamed protein product [Durusdinium trenchii]|uniref:Uncharacterized protein n=2 Tax=Durusdinium trenchii TaxID=1381693 RepID=A0ABP0R4P1_9DINO